MLSKAKLNSIEVLIFKAFIDSDINNDKFVSKNYVLKEYAEIKGEIRNPNNKLLYKYNKLLLLKNLM